MKNAVLSFILILLFLLAGIFVLSAGAKDNRKNELEESLDRAVKQSLLDLNVSEGFRDMEEARREHVAADMIQTMMVQHTSLSNVSVRILQADFEKGMLDVEAVQEYQNLAGKKTVLKARRIAVLDQYKAEQVYFTVSVKAVSSDGMKMNLKQTQIAEGSSMEEPDRPERFAGKPFTGWTCEQKPGWTGDFTEITVTENMTFTAHYG